jgi:hypothetical protein
MESVFAAEDLPMPADILVPDEVSYAAFAAIANRAPARRA